MRDELALRKALLQADRGETASAESTVRALLDRRTTEPGAEAR